MMKFTLKDIRQAEAIVRSRYPDITVDELDDEVQDVLADWAADASEDAELRNAEDSPCVQSADLWGTGEGAYHGIID